MKIKDKTCIVFDIEVLKNIFTCTCKNTDTGVIMERSWLETKDLNSLIQEK